MFTIIIINKYLLKMTKLSLLAYSYFILNLFCLGDSLKRVSAETVISVKYTHLNQGVNLSFSVTYAVVLVLCFT